MTYHMKHEMLSFIIPHHEMLSFILSFVRQTHVVYRDMTHVVYRDMTHVVYGGFIRQMHAAKMHAILPWCLDAITMYQTHVMEIYET